MDILVICLAIVVFLPIVAKAPVAVAMNRLGGYDNAHPRAQQAKLTGFGARALAAHQNAFEALMMFAPVLLCAMVLGKTGDVVQWAAIGFVLMRIAYNILYLINWSTLRSISWAVGGACKVTIVVQCFM